MNNYDDLSPAVIRSGLKGAKYSNIPLNNIFSVDINP